MDQVVAFINTLSNPILTACVIYVAKSMHELNLKLAVVIARLESLEVRTKRLEDREL